MYIECVSVFKKNKPESLVRAIRLDHSEDCQRNCSFKYVQE